MNGRWFGVCCMLALAACDGDGGTDAGGGSDAGAMDAGDSDGGGGSDAAMDGGGPTRPLGAACDDDGQCQSGVCFNATAGLELGTGYCTLDCAASSACDGFPSDGYEYGCVAVADGLRCARLCPDGFGCGEDDLCVTNFGSPEADICLDLSNDRCTSNADCAGGVNDLCTILTDRDSAVTACFHGREAFGGDPIPFKAVGDTCTILPETPCTTTADCPTGYRCQRGEDGRDRCNPMPSETCHLFCLLPGRCTGICESDADCPTDMRCSEIDANFLTNTPGAFDDGPYVTLNVCTYAAGSRTSCTAEADCDATGAGGADEVCWPTTDADGAFDAICVTPTGAGQPGDPCGDDPTTDDVENRLCDGACVFNRCAGVCASDADCTGARCLLLDGSPRASNSACVVGADCMDGTDCGAGEVCGAVLDARGAAESMCTPAQGQLADGARCEAGAGAFVPVTERCMRDCLDTGRGRDEGRCRQPCVADADCDADSICGAITLAVDSRGTFPDRSDDDTATLHQCQYLPGSRDPCTADDDCAADERCSYAIDTTGAVDTLCTTAVPGGGATGEACDTLESPCANPGACFSRWEDPSTSYCSTLCTADADCPMGFVCRRPSLGIVGTFPRVCLTPEDPRGVP